ncbi:MAG: glycosyltransferase family 2 protein [Bacteroidota bacterium]
MKAKVSIISVNYKQYAASHEFLTACRELSYPELEVILVDNESEEEKLVSLEKDFPEVIFLASSQNLGFAGGNNLGITKAKGDYFLFLNNDTLPRANLVENLLEGFGYQHDIGAVSPKILYLDPPGVIQFAGYTPINPFTGRNKTLGQGEKDQGQYDQAHIIPYAHGAAMMLRKEVIEKVGKMPEEFFLYYEELDWSVQIRNAGYHICFFPKASIYHHASLSTGQNSPLKTYYYYRNRILFMRRNSPTGARLIFLSYFFLILSPVKYLLFLLRGKTAHRKALLNALSWHFTKS